MSMINLKSTMLEKNKKYIFHILFPLFFLLIFNNQISKATQQKDLSNSLIQRPEKVVEKKLKQLEINNVVPKSLIQYINEKYIDYKILSLDDYNNGWKQYTSQNMLPFLSSSDFDGNGIKDYALLMQKDSIEIYLYSFHADSCMYTSHLIDVYKKITETIDIVVVIEEKGIWENFEKSIDVKNDGILVYFMSESKSKNYYWDGSKYVRFFGN